MFDSGSRVFVAPSILSCKALRDRFLSGERIFKPPFLRQSLHLLVTTQHMLFLWLIKNRRRFQKKNIENFFFFFPQGYLFKLLIYL